MHENIDNVLSSIASKYLYIDSLETANVDEKDFREVAVWSVKEALLTAFEMGQEWSKNK